MAKKDPFLTTGEFASKAGIPTSSVTKLIKEGKIKAEKKSGKWKISPDQLKAQPVKDLIAPPGKAGGKKAVKPAKKKTAAQKTAPTKRDKPTKVRSTGGKTFTVAEFAAMTYLTELGVRQWLKQGRLTGHQGAGGEWEIDPANLELPDLKRLVR